MKRYFSLVALCCLILSTAGADTLKATGKVLGPDDKPLGGVAVYIIGSSPYPAKGERQIVRADAAGAFHVELNAGIARPYIGSAITVVPGLALGGTMLKTDDAASPGIDNIIRLTPPSMVRGMVRGADGRPLPGAKVRVQGVYNERSFSLWYTEEIWKGLLGGMVTTTDANGRWQIAGLPQTGRASFTFDEKWQQVLSTVTLAPGRVVAPPLVARPAVEIKGRAVDEKGEPVGGAAVIAAGTTARGQGTVTYGSAETARDGSFTLRGMAAGSYKISVRAQYGEMAAPVAASITAAVGEAANCGDIVLKSAQRLRGQVMDEETGKPIAGVQAYLTATGPPQNALYSQMTGDDGVLIVYALPGEYQLAVMPPSGYQRNFNRQRLVVTPETTTVPEIKLRKAIALTGTAFDEQGKPAVGAQVTTQFYSGGGAVGADGAWRIEDGMAQGQVTLGALGEWEVLNPPKVELPLKEALREPLKLTLRRTPLVALKGRVIGLNGQPLGDVPVQVRVSITAEQNGWNMHMLATDEDGSYMLPNLHPKRSVQVEVKTAGYRYERGGAVKTTDAGGFVADDIVLSPLTQTIKGKVVDEAGKPVAGAVVGSLGGMPAARAVTDATGAFALAGQPEGNVVLLAGSGTAFGQAPATTQANPVVQLAAGQPVPAGDPDAVIALLQIAEKKNPNTRLNMSYNAALRVAREEPDRAIEMVTDDDGNIRDETLGAVVTTYTKQHPEQAVEWSLPQIERIKGAQARQSALINVAMAVAANNPALAKELYQRAKAAFKPMDYTRETALAYCQVAALAGRLKLPDAKELVEAAVLTAQRAIGADELAWAWGMYATTLAQGGLSLPATLTEGMEPYRKLEMLSRIVAQMARSDARAAAAMLPEMEKLAAADPAGPENGRYRQPSSELVGQANAGVARALAASEPEAALVYARKSPQYTRGWTIAAVASRMKGDAARRAFDEAWQSQNVDLYGVANAARIALLAWRFDHALGDVYWRQIDDRMAALYESGGDELRYTSLAGVAFYLAQIDPARARIILETEFDRVKPEVERAKQPGQPNQGSYLIQMIVRAMVAVDVGRALEMAAVEPTDYMRNAQYGFMADYLASAAEERAVRSFDGYGGMEVEP